MHKLFRRISTNVYTGAINILVRLDKTYYNSSMPGGELRDQAKRLGRAILLGGREGRRSPS